jgi:chromosome partitioning protein
MARSHIMKPITISIAGIKGGTGKSQSSLALAAYLGKRHKVLLWDNDPQRTSTMATVDTAEIRYTAYDIIHKKVDPSLAVLKAVPGYQNVDVIPASNLLTGLEAETASNIDKMFLFSDAVTALPQYDFLIFDCPSGQSLLTTGSMVASEIAICPILRGHYPVAFIFCNHY